LNKAINLDAKRSFYHYLLGIVYSEQNKWLHAEESLLIAKSLNYATSKFYYRLGVACFEVRHFSEAKKAFKQSADKWSEKLSSSILIQDLYYMIGLSSELLASYKNKESDFYYNKAIEFDEDYNSKELGIGIFHEKNKHYEMAIESY